jgi:diguanylate cyclase (GGDEF)-like protein
MSPDGAAGRVARRAFAWLLLLSCPACPAWADTQAPAVQLAVLETVGRDAPVGAVLAGDYDAQFQARPSADAVLHGGPGRNFWLRLSFSAPPEALPAPEGWVLLFDRIDLEHIALFLPQPDGTTRRPFDGFFDPLPGGTLSPDSFAFALSPAGVVPPKVYVHVDGLTRMNVAPRVLSQAEFRDYDRHVASLTGATYAAMIVLMLSALALFLALRERAYLWFVGLTAGLLVTLFAVNGHLYRVPGAALFGWWGSDGLHALMLACCALALGFSRHFLETPRDARLDRILRGAQMALVATAVLCLLNLDSLTARMQMIAGLLSVATAAGIALLALAAWRRGETLARAYCLIWVILAAAVGLRVAVAVGWLSQNALTLYGFQIATAFCLFLMSVGQADRVMEFRKQRDRARLLKEQTDASLQVEQVRREFAEGLREQLRSTTPGGDLEWLAFKRLLSALHQLLPQQGSALVAFGYHGLDLLMCEPMDAKERFTRLLAARGGTLKGLCRSRNPVQARLDEQTEPDAPVLNPTGGLFAVVPIPMPVPGWGALLIERAPWEQFEVAELKLAAEFLKQAVATTDEAASQAELKRKAEIDPLTGAGNRRNGDVMLERALKRAIGDRKPLSVLFVDLDHFKQVNDKHGHAVGDDCLRLCADAVRRELGVDDVLVRYGGEEFLVILPGAAADQARQLGERIRQSISQLRLDNGGVPVRFTVSIGVAGRLPNEEASAGMVERADRALYTAKRNGRNQVQVAQLYGYGQQPQEEEPPPPLTL